MLKKTLVLSITLSCGLLLTQTYADTAVGAFVKNDGWSLDAIDQYNNNVSRPAATINLFSTFTANWNEHLNYQASNIVSRNAVPMITWMPYDRNRPDQSILNEISSGQWDEYINNWIEGFKNWQNTYSSEEKPSIMLRFGHEFNGNWYTWGNKPETFKAAWQYLHDAFEEADINDSVDWVWCASSTDVDDYNDITRYYPGDDYVDWLSLDGYNWGSNFSWSHWKTFDETFSQSYVKLVKNYPEKPIIIAEIGSAEPHDQPNPDWGQNGDDSDSIESKEVWVADMMKSVRENYPSIHGIVWFNINKELSWALTLDGNTGLNAFNRALSKHYFSGSLKKVEFEDELKNTGRKGQVTGIARAIQVSNMPDVVGEKLLEKEANGIRNMSKQALRKWRMGRILNDD